MTDFTDIGMENNINNNQRTWRGKLLNKKLWLYFAAEFLGTGLLLFITCGASLKWPTLPAPSILHSSLTVGLCVSTLIISFGHITGGHVNPSVTLGFVVSRRLSPLDGLFMVCGQFLGGITGTALLYGLTPREVSEAGFSVTALASNLHLAQAVGIEVLLTFALIFTIFAVTDAKKYQRFPEFCAPFFIGFSLFTCLMVGIPFTGASLNPARSFAPALVTNSWKHHWVYWVGPALGAILGALLYEKVFTFKEYAMTPPASAEGQAI